MHLGVSPGLGLDGIEEVARVDFGLFLNDCVCRRLKIIGGLLLAQVHAVLRVAAFRERVQGMIGSVCAEEFVAKPSFMGCQRCDYRDLCEVGEKSGE